ncbi:MAG: 3-oxoacyl-ACP reductase family protein [Planctomycetia bacterium]|nr:3-oxoacyl-ACP reductase family protein [Planctomycetia bacterium]
MSKIALVTGAGRGIGAAIAEALGKAGFLTWVNYSKSSEAAEKVCARIREAGGNAYPIQADVGKYSDIQKMFDEIEKKHGAVDILVNNAGIEIRMPATDYPEEIYDSIMNINLKGAYFCSQRALRTMKKRNWGRIINISSVHEERPTGNRGIYSISKAGMWMMTREHAKEYGTFGITVNSIAPGAIRTDLNRKVLEDPAYEEMVLRNIPAKFIAEPYDISGAVVFLTSEEARYVNGASLTIDGGLSLN